MICTKVFSICYSCARMKKFSVKLHLTLSLFAVNAKYGKSTALEFINQCSEKWISDMILLETRYARLELNDR